VGNSDAVTDEFHAHRRDLPHFQQGGSTYFITFRLFKPETAVPLTGEEREVVKQAILALHERMWRVHMLTVMANHAHILATPLRQAPGKWYGLSVILQRVKGGSAYRINTHRQTTGQLWQRESFDRIIRNETEYLEKATYILNNAVKAEIVEDGWTYDGFWYHGGDMAG
jgi:REP-associated tyrosine transposase